ncbi:Transposon TX1 uncharacterized 149 kDa protein [Trametes pubescens]|uniref:Transposon TX1 uncharacterized 149 kDa protein n=1 Tax=Trametes pubescens TaxID=154538 RepID=A0A1M2VBI5_TRAPU|nr:Transposon TX1 uncharacterized 149 kDa protein [Trametes pubescens]
MAARPARQANNYYQSMPEASVYQHTEGLQQQLDGNYGNGTEATRFGGASGSAASQNSEDEQGRGNSEQVPLGEGGGEHSAVPRMPEPGAAQPDRVRNASRIDEQAAMLQNVLDRDGQRRGDTPEVSAGDAQLAQDQIGQTEIGHAPRRSRRRDEQIARKTATKVATLNINGFGTLLPDHPDNKWGRLYRMMKDQRIGILMVQETHLTEQRVADIHRMYAGSLKIFHSPHPESPTQKEGVAIVINTKLVSTVGAKARVIIPGRAIQVSVAWRGGDTRHLLCVYAPTSEGVLERADFFENVEQYYNAHPNVPLPHAMAGDFNNVEDIIDRLPMTDAGDSSVEKLDSLKMRLGLMIADGWRITHPTDRDYTFHRGVGDVATMSRLDRIYVTAEVFDFARGWIISQPGVKTDHLLMSVQLTTPNAPVAGPGRPVFPLCMLKNKTLAKRMKARGMQASTELKDMKTQGLRTDIHNPQTILCKMKADWFTMAREHEKATVPKLLRDIQELEKRLKEVKADESRTERVRASDVNALTKQVQDLKAKHLKQQQENSRAKHRMDGERPTKYWVHLNKAKTPRDLIPAFERLRREGSGEEATFETDSRKMAQMARAHHNGIQRDGPDVSPPEVRAQDIETVIASIEVTLTDEQTEVMDATITYNECELALLCAKTGTAPGVDGIQYEVWKTVNEHFREDSRHPAKPVFDALEILAAVFIDIQENGVCASTSFAEGWMSPIWKEKGEKTKIVNYRPIMLLNSDYKLLSKLLAIRMADVAPNIVHPAQVGFVPGRKLRDHTQLARMMMHWAEATEVNGAIVALDQEKAYNKIAHDYLWRVLEKFRVPQSYICILKSLYSEARTSVMVNGTLSEPYRVTRGVRQGDPLSCLLFDLAIEPLSSMIRKSEIVGLNVPNQIETLKATLFADDTTVYLSSADDFAALQHVLDVWCSATKAKFNIAKTEIIPIGEKCH